jgi:DNA (cytosine-5)-methyltransferase 1
MFLHDVVQALSAPSAPVSWAIGDLLSCPQNTLMDTPASLTEVNRARVDYLFDNDMYDLPDDQRPDCHKGGTSYRSVYGRMQWDQPSQTITTGFNTTGRGRYIHPLRRTVITPREAARLQGFPDWFSFAPSSFPVRRNNLAKWIGDAVHPLLGYAAGLAALSATMLERRK